MGTYQEYKQLKLNEIATEVGEGWEKNRIFEKSISEREGMPAFVFYEGPPSANGLPGIHHVMARTIKDIFCRYQTLKGKQVHRKAGWDTHGLPVELGVEKALGITKEDIGKTISIEAYNEACRKDVMKYTDVWNKLTKQMGYWVDMEHPYVTCDTDYIESVWWLLKNLHQKNYLYKGYTIQPYSPKAGTGLSSHELNQPGCYKQVKDRSAVAMFEAQPNNKTNVLWGDNKVYFLAWTTTPWTLSSNTALAVGKDIEYVLVKTVNPFTLTVVCVMLAKNCFSSYFELPESGKELRTGDRKSSVEAHLPSNDFFDVAIISSHKKEIVLKGKIAHWEIIGFYEGKQLTGITYHQLLPYAQPYINAENSGVPFRVIEGDFVTTTDGTGIVHIAPTFGADDMRAAKQAGVPAMLVRDETVIAYEKLLPLVNLQGRYRAEMGLFAGEYVKQEYLSETEKIAAIEKQKTYSGSALHDLIARIVNRTGEYLAVDEQIVLKLELDGLLFKKETYEHAYPHCWRTDKPVLYYPLDSWFVRTTAARERMIELNKTIKWKPESTGTGRFGNWLENLVDWNLSRSRYWGIPLPVWRTSDGSEEKCIGSVEELKAEIAKAKAAGIETADDVHNLHRPFVDNIILCSETGKKMHRESDLIDVWFDSGAMPFAQLHYPFENSEAIDKRQRFPADFIAEGVDQTRGWFFTLHAIATLVFDSVAFKAVVSNGLVLDKNGNKMSKRLGNAVDPFKTIDAYGPDATRWYMIANAQPWDNLKFDEEGIVEVQRSLFSTLHNTYQFFAMYANIDKFTFTEPEIPIQERPEIDRWILSSLQTVCKQCDAAFTDYEPTRAARTIQSFTDELLSNWYVRLCRRRFWKGEYSNDKISAYQTLYTCLETLAILMSPIAPFYADKLFGDLNKVSKRNPAESVHLAYFPEPKNAWIDLSLEERMETARQISSMVLSIRKKENIKVRQPLARLRIPVLNKDAMENLGKVEDLVKAEVNVKEIEFVTENEVQITKNLKLNFKSLGKKFGPLMKAIQDHAATEQTRVIQSIESAGRYTFNCQDREVELLAEDVEIIPVDIPGWKVANQGAYTVALDIQLTESLKNEGLARELVNRLQNLRKEKGYEITDRIRLKIQEDERISPVIIANKTYICAEILADSLEFSNNIPDNQMVELVLEEGVHTKVSIEK
jgi:isoleucyl-tRNA synthetase